jgi:GDSL-like Lipase/Acylhydrolase family
MMAEKITFSELTARIAKGELKKNEIASYFEVDAANSTTFQPRFRVNTETVDVTGVEGAAQASGHALALDAERQAQPKALAPQAAMAAAAEAAVILAEGDSWFSHPLVKTPIHVLQENGYNIVNLAKAGDTLEGMLTRRQYAPFLRAGGVSHFLFSGGGNDVLGELRDLLNQISFSHTDPKNPAHVAFYVKPDFRAVLTLLRARYVRLIDDVRSISPGTRLMLNGYAYARAVGHGPFIGDDFEFLGFDLTHQPEHVQLAWAIIRSMVDRFNVMLKNLAANTSSVSYQDLRPVVSQTDPLDWFDAELHPSRRAAKRIAQVFADELPEPATITV